MVGTHGHFICFLYIFMLDFVRIFLNQYVHSSLKKQLIAIAH